MIVALVIGRKGSIGFPGKNRRAVLGRPLAAYPIMAAINAKGVRRVFLSTDDEFLMEVARKYGAEVIVRPPELATKEALGEDVFCHGYRTIRDVVMDGKDTIELVVLLFCNAATIVSLTIDQGISVLEDHEEYDSAVTVSMYNMWSPLRARRIGKEDGLLHPFVPFESFGDPATLNCDRDSQGEVWFADMGVSVVRPRCLENAKEGLLPQRWMGNRIYPLKQWGGCDVDFEWQIPGVEFWLRTHGFSESDTPYSLGRPCR